MITYQYDDGGRAAAGYKGSAGDCVPRAIAIATELPYAEVYAELTDRQRAYFATTRSRKRLTRAGNERKPGARNGVFGKEVAGPYLAELGWQWQPTMTIGSGTTVHLRAEELPAGRIITRLSRHFAAVIDGVVHDTYDPSRGGTRAVYGYWHR